LWEPSTKQFYSKCQSSRDLPSSQSARSTAAPSCIGSCPASRQSVTDGHPERHTVSEFSSTTQTMNKCEPACSEQLRVSASLLVLPRAFTSCHVTATKMDRPSHEPSFPALLSMRASPALPAATVFIQSSTVMVFILLHTSYEQQPFQGLPRIFGVWGAWSHTKMKHG
jgi:hypothetical protein